MQSLKKAIKLTEQQNNPIIQDKFDLTNFQYKDHNSIRFKGTFGVVELMFFRPSKEEQEEEKSKWDFLNIEQPEGPTSYFIAYLFLDNNFNLPKFLAKSIAPERAIIDLYTEYAKAVAHKDLNSA